MCCKEPAFAPQALSHLTGNISNAKCAGKEVLVSSPYCLCERLCNKGKVHSSVAGQLLCLHKVPGSIPGIAKQGWECPHFETLEGYCQPVWTILNQMDQWSEVVYKAAPCVPKTLDG